MRVVVTGSTGLLGRHAAVRLHAAARAGREIEIRLPSRAEMADPGALAAAVAGAGAVLHCAGASRGPAEEVERANPALAEALARAIEASGAAPQVVHAGSRRSGEDTPYGRGKARAAAILGDAAPLTEIALPHLFGEGARPFHNSVTATFAAHLAAGTAPKVDPEGEVELLHAGAAADIAIGAIGAPPSRLAPRGRRIRVGDLWDAMEGMLRAYEGGRVPDLSDPFRRDLFNSLRAALPGTGRPSALTLHADARGHLFEAVRGAGGQSFVSTTRPGVTRGDHFHLSKMERFLVLRGRAAIRVRPVLGGKVREHLVTGEAPMAVDIPTLHAHSIQNVGEGELLTLFWAHEPFDPAAPDTYAEPVL